MGMAGASGGGTKGTSSASNTGQPAWASGTGNGMAGSSGIQGQQNSLSGNWQTPGTDAYNNMNNAMTTQPMGNLVNILQNGGMGNVMNGAMNNLANNSGTNDWMNQAADMYGKMGEQGAQNYQDIFNSSRSPWANEQYLTGMANGSQIGNSPYLDSIISKGQDEAASANNQMFAAGGRYGGGMNQGTTAEAVAGLGNQLRYTDYTDSLNRQLQASNAISTEQGNRGNLGLGAAGGLSNVQSGAAAGLGGLGQNKMQNWMGSQQAAAGLQNQGIQNQFGAMGQLGNVQANKMFDANQQAAVGQETTQASQNQLNDLINQWTGGDMEGWSRLGGLLSAGTGSASNYGTQSGTSKTSSSPGWAASSAAF